MSLAEQPQAPSKDSIKDQTHPQPLKKAAFTHPEINHHIDQDEDQFLTIDSYNYQQT